MKICKKHLVFEATNKKVRSASCKRLIQIVSQQGIKDPYTMSNQVWANT